MKEQIKQLNVKENIEIILFVTVLLFVFAPLELYLSSKDYFFFGGWEMFKYIIPVGIVFLIASTFFLCVIKQIAENIWKYVVSMVFAIAILMYFQGNYWLVNYGTLDGEVVEWSNYRWEGILNVIIWFAVIIALLIVTRKCDFSKVGRVYGIISICLILVMISTLSVLLINNGGLNKKPQYQSTTIGEFSYSKDENLTVIMLDSYDASILKEILDSDVTDHYSDILRDFVFYPDTTGMYSYTALAVPYILTGKKYLNDCTYGEYLEKAYDESPILTKIREDDWGTGIYNITMMPQDEDVSVADNCSWVHNTVSSHRRLLTYVYKLIAYRYFPQPLKPYFWFYADEMESELKSNEEGLNIFTESNYAFDRASEEIEVDASSKQFKFYTLFGAHQPYYMTEDFKESDSETDVIQTSKGVLEMVNNYLNRLRASGAYDNSTIVILADHGIYKRYNPMFLIKYACADSELEISDIPFSYDSLQDVLTGLSDGNNKEQNESMMLKKVTGLRKFMSYDHSSGIGYDNYFDDIYECEIEGVAWDDAIINKTGTVYTALDFYRK